MKRRFKRWLVNRVYAYVHWRYRHDTEGDDVCCCGDAMTNHGWEHSPVSMRAYALDCVAQRLLKRLGLADS